MIDHAFRAIHYLQGDSGDTKPCPACGAPCLEGEVCSDECIILPDLRKLAASLDRSDFTAETRTDVIMSFTEWCFGSIDELDTLGEIIMHVDHFPDADFCVLQFLHECIVQATICTWGGCSGPTQKTSFFNNRVFRGGHRPNVALGVNAFGTGRGIFLRFALKEVYPPSRTDAFRRVASVVVLN